MKMHILSKGLWIAVLASLFDQLVHIGGNLPHNIITHNPTISETLAYISIKFIFVMLISSGFIWLSIYSRFIYLKSRLILSVLIGLIGAVLFSIVIFYMFPYAYGIEIHMFHAIAISLAAWIVLIGENWYGRLIRSR